MTAYTFNDRLFAFEVFDDEVVVLHVTEGTYFACGGWVVEAWSALTTGCSTQRIVDAVSGHYGIAANEIERELTDLTARLEQEAIFLNVEAGDVDEAIVTFSGRPFQSASFEKHADMQDLLTLDPIHDVDPKKGWPILS
ncbi:PqqD family protein [Mesorhizobium sp. ES1-4]|uniref:PqqD family protein n=1 Tax=Mesorhizobium sp. ES1-4 TaxID=2876627 RepID=UPI001CD024ED|nr:PqqD family protein [Mesorhizobium sp. ES1-4]MBZ9796268.1 PqqD family protein [Mesorhizobium sp. ES1-4]